MFHSLSYWSNNINDYRLAKYCLNKSFPYGSNVREPVVELGEKLRKNESMIVVKPALTKALLARRTKVWVEDPKHKDHGKFEDDTTLQGYFREIISWGEAEGFWQVS
jgi:hypothetical protein